VLNDCLCKMNLRQRNRGGAADDHLSMCFRRPLGERDVNADFKQPTVSSCLPYRISPCFWTCPRCFHSCCALVQSQMRVHEQARVPVKAKQSPMVDRQREIAVDMGLSSSSRVGSSIGVLKIPKRLAGTQAKRMEQGIKRRHPFNDFSVESPYKRATSGQDLASSSPQPSFVPVSLALGAQDAPAKSASHNGAEAIGGQLVSGENSGRQAPYGSTPQFVAELKAKLRERREAEERNASGRWGIDGLKDIRDVFVKILSNVKNFTEGILRDDDDSDGWEWTEHTGSPLQQQQSSLNHARPADEFAANCERKAAPAKAELDYPWDDRCSETSSLTSLDSFQGGCKTARRGHDRMDRGGVCSAKT
jgi:hypothetical protein